MIAPTELGGTRESNVAPTRLEQLMGCRCLKARHWSELETIVNKHKAAGILFEVSAATVATGCSSG